ncbi:MAG: MFS transporter [Spongiibacteraceae bacterium]|jgi:AAHS family 4-hydroxybenzoate transporter-like MFS transporter|nr:MFS transporter [Spongiibacteraceae bacterium]
MNSSQAGLAEAQRPVTLDQWLDRHRIVPLQVLIYIASGCVMLIDGFDLQALSLAAPALLQEWQVPASALGLAFSLTLAGLGVGAALLGPLGDGFGRKPVLLGSLLLLSVTSLATAAVNSLFLLYLCRFLTGVAMGGANVSALALTTDYAPPRRRILIMSLVAANMATGAIVAGLIAPEIISWLGWRGLFLLGGALPLLMMLCCALLPDSLSQLQRRRTRTYQKTVARIAGEEQAPLIAATQKETSRYPLRELFRRDLRIRTLALWSLYGIGAFNLYLLISWLPTLLGGAGFSEATALRGSVAFQIGGLLGSIGMAMLIDRGKLIATLGWVYGATAVVLASLIVLPAERLLWGIALIIIGLGVAGTQVVVLNIATALYPPTLRATSSGWTLAVARLTAVLGPVAGGVLLGHAVPAPLVLALVTIPLAVQTLILLSARHALRPGHSG